MSGFVKIESKESVVVLTLDNRDRNAIGSRADCEEFIAAIEQAERDASTKVIIITGAGDAFCSGGNLRTMREPADFTRGANPVATRDNYRTGIQKLARTLWSTEVPTIAAVNGWAIGLGCDLACMCDLRIAAQSARFASSFLKVGLIPGDGGAWFLPRVVGFAKAAEMIFTARTVDAQQALACGLVSQVVTGEELLPAAQALAASIAAQPPQALRLAKRLLRESQHARVEDVLELSAAYQALVQESSDHAEGVAAALAKRTPRFVGR